MSELFDEHMNVLQHWKWFICNAWTFVYTLLCTAAYRQALHRT